MNEAIKAHLGIKSCQRCSDPECAYNMTKDYSGDLNACHEMEKSLPKDLNTWVDYLEWINYEPDATAMQRAEAFLRTVGKWKEAE